MRAKPFSGKKKKAQLQEKRQRKSNGDQCDIKVEAPQKPGSLISKWETRTDAVKISPHDDPAYVQEIQRLPKECSETSFEEVYNQGEVALSLPVRPVWSYEMSKEELKSREEDYFKGWLDGVYKECQGTELSYFEHNLEVWRQLWRVCEISDLLLVVVDIRHPVLNFPPSLYRYVLEVLKRPLWMVLTKTDMVAPAVVQEWTKYIKECFPLVIIHELSIFHLGETKPGKPKRYVSAFGVDKLLEDLRENSPKAFHDEWSQFIAKRLPSTAPKQDSSNSSELYTIGTIGHPNAGKSSLINSIVGRTVVSASRTPGHTKHFQTIHLTKHIRLCDCPGLIFPMRVPKWLQILTGLYNVAQVKDPYEPLMRLAAHIDLESALGLPPGPRNILQVCSDFAEQRGFYTAKAARPDIYRAANYILRAVIDGRISLSWKPPGYYKSHQEELRMTSSVVSEEEDSSGPEEEEEGVPSDHELVVTGVLGGSFGRLLEVDSEDGLV